jgi:hypothetical protein
MRSREKSLKRLLIASSFGWVTACDRPDNPWPHEQGGSAGAAGSGTAGASGAPGGAGGVAAQGGVGGSVPTGTGGAIAGGGPTCVQRDPACESAADCGRGRYCAASQCVAGAALHEPCGGGIGCGQDLICVAGECVPALGERESCADLGAGCREGLVCAWVTNDEACPDGVGCDLCIVPGSRLSCRQNFECGPNRFCNEWMCDDLRPEGAFCLDGTADPNWCLPGLYCGDTPIGCRAEPQPGEPCGFGPGGLVCTAGAYCDVQSTTCVAYPGPGQPCVNGKCRADSYCSNDPEPTCHARPAQGEACQAGTCQEGLVCPTPPTGGLPPGSVALAPPP